MIRKERFGVTRTGEEVFQYVLANTAGLEVSLLTYGASIHRIRMAGRDGAVRDLTLYYKDLTGYEEDTSYCIGRTVGPHANRIGGASFSIGDQEYTLEANDGANNLHSGSACWGFRVWGSRTEGDTVVMTIRAEDGEGGFPGNREASVSFSLTEDGELQIRYQAVSDRDTVFNMTNHSYFHLGADPAGHIFGTRLRILADAFTEAGEGLIPTGKLRETAGSVFDFREGKPIGDGAFDPRENQLTLAGGYDHNFVIRGDGFRLAAEAWAPDTGVCLQVYTDMPGMQFYAGNFLGAPFAVNTGFALETQYFPDSVHHPVFPSVTVKAGKIWNSRTGLRFSVR